MEPALASQHPAEVALRHGDGVGALALPVEHAWDEAGLAQATSLAGPSLLALGDLQLDSFARHDGGEW
jgi:hypothetical protein